MVNLVGEVPRAVAIVGGGGGLDEARAVVAAFIIRIVEGVDVDGQSPGMFRQLAAACYGTIAERRRVVVAHLGLVVGIIDIGQEHALDRVLGIEELTQDTDHAVGNLLVYYHLAHVHLVVVVPVQGADVA